MRSSDWSSDVCSSDLESLKSPDTAVSFASLQAFRAEVLRSSPSRLGILRREEHERRASSQFRKKGARGVFSGPSVRQNLLPDRLLLPFPRPPKLRLGSAPQMARANCRQRWFQYAKI